MVHYLVATKFVHLSVGCTEHTDLFVSDTSVCLSLKDVCGVFLQRVLRYEYWYYIRDGVAFAHLSLDTCGRYNASVITVNCAGHVFELVVLSCTYLHPTIQIVCFLIVAEPCVVDRLQIRWIAGIIGCECIVRVLAERFRWTVHVYLSLTQANDDIV